MARSKKEDHAPVQAEQPATTLAERPARQEVVRVNEVPDLGTIFKEVMTGNLQALTDEQQAKYLLAVCQGLGLNPATAPFAIITFKGKKTLYARRECTEQLRRIYQVSVQIVGREHHGDTYAVTARAILPGGRSDESIGAVSLRGLTGEDLANAIMKAETKAKRRVTLSICGLGCLDESEVEPVVQASPAVQVEAQAAQPPAALPGRPDAAHQIDRLRQDLNWTPGDLSAALTRRFGVSDPRQLTSEQAQQVIAGMENAQQATRVTVSPAATAADGKPQALPPAVAPPAASPAAQQAPAQKATQTQLERIDELAREVGWSNDKLAESVLKKFGNRNLRDLASEQAAQVIAGLEQLKARQGGGK